MTDIELFKEFVTVEGSTPKTDSRVVASKFGKRHKNVLRSIDTIISEVSNKFAKLNFELCFEINGLQNGKPNKFYKMTKNGFMLLVMGFTGKAAMAIKERFIDAFDEMESFIKSQYSSLWERKMMLELKDENSFLRASFGSKLMLQRKQEKLIIQNELAKLDKMLQPNLFLV